MEAKDDIVFDRIERMAWSILTGKLGENKQNGS
jgi:hypothetical protein